MFLDSDVTLLIARVSLNATDDVAPGESNQNHHCEEQNYQFFTHLIINLAHGTCTLVSEGMYRGIISSCFTRGQSNGTCGLEGHPFQCLLHQITCNGIHTCSLPVDGYLAIRPCSRWVIEQNTKIVNLTLTSKIIQDIIYEVQQFSNCITHTQMAILYKIDDLCVQAITHSTPLVLINVMAGQHMGSHAMLM